MRREGGNRERMCPWRASAGVLEQVRRGETGQAAVKTWDVKARLDSLAQ